MKGDCQISAESQPKFHKPKIPQTQFLNYKDTGQMFTKFLYNVAA